MEHVEAHFIGLDVGRAVDHSALCVLARRLETTQPGSMDPAHLFHRYYVTYLRRFSLGTEYELIENEVVRLWKLPELIPTRNYCFVDQTGVGAPIVESLRRKKVPVNGIIITSGNTVNNPQPNEWHVPKSELVSALAKVVQIGRLKIVQGVENWKELKDELQTFGYKVNRETGNLSYEALEERVHDDLVISLALGIWYAEKNVPSAWPRKRSYVAKSYNPLAQGAG